jgi:dihydrofolate synthase/folylpolyglutamate synthase
LGHPERHFASIHIGGTNGKGSVATLCYAALRAAGYRTGIYTSPHLVDVRERMVVDGRPITPEAFAAWTERLRAVIERTGASFFEATTAIAFADLAARGVEIAVIEVGLGGRLDCTNVIDPLVSAVTHVGLEHTEFLGSTLAAIAREKAGIAKPGRPFVIGEPDRGVADVLKQVATQAGASVVAVPGDARYPGPLALMGGYQRRNAAIALAMLRELPDAWQPGRDAIETAFNHATVAGRMDRRGKWLFDVAHNAGGMAALTEAVKDQAIVRPVHAVVGILRDKDWRAMLGLLGQAVDHVWLTQPPTAPEERRWDLEEVAQWASGQREGAMPYRGDSTAGPFLRHTTQPNFEQALRDAQVDAGTVLVTGSFHTVGDALARLPGFAPLG